MHTIKHKQQGNILLKAIIFLPGALILLALAYFGFCEARKAYWDNQVKLMCEKDGGLTIYEKVIISRSQNKNLFSDVNGVLNIPYEFMAKPDQAYYIKSMPSQILKEHNPTVRKHEYFYVRHIDKKIIAKDIHYGRSGGDFPTGIGHDSSYVCPSVQQSSRSLQSLFIIQE